MCMHTRKSASTARRPPFVDLFSKAMSLQPVAAATIGFPALIHAADAGKSAVCAQIAEQLHDHAIAYNSYAIHPAPARHQCAA